MLGWISGTLFLGPFVLEGKNLADSKDVYMHIALPVDGLAVTGRNMPAAMVFSILLG